MRSNHTILISLLITIFGSCKEIYKPEIIASPVSYLVVEGVLNAGQGPTSIRISRTFSLDDSARLRGERNAQVTVEGEDNIPRSLVMTADGVYTSPALNLETGSQYRLRIRTAGGKEYLSDNMLARKTPAIDSLGFREEQDGVLVHVSTHDPNNDTWYYRWEFEETWEIRSYYYSEYKYVNGKVTQRGPGDNVSVCWKHDISKKILAGSTISLNADIVYRSPLTFISRGDEKLAVRYSMLAKQYAIDKPAFEFFGLMKKNTESLGSIFDPQPSETRGNIRCISDPAEPVIGYINASTIEEKRFFIRADQLNGWRFYEDCPMLTVPNHPDSIKVAYDSGQSIFNAMFSDFSPLPVAYYISYNRCVECTARGGSLQKPAFW